MKISRGVWAIIIILFVIIADQTLKIWIKTHFYLGEDYQITPWFHLKFIENNGMAFGMELWSKVLLTSLRLVAVAFLIWVLFKIKNVKSIRNGCLVAMALITAGAAGNIFDCVLYGRIFTNPMPPLVAQFSDFNGYAPWFEGQVVDMLYFPLFNIHLPSWFPFGGGTDYEFFQYIFNIADASICIGVLLLLIFYSKDFYEMLSIAGKHLKRQK